MDLLFHINTLRITFWEIEHCIDYLLSLGREKVMLAGVRLGKDKRLEQRAIKYGHVTLSESQRFCKRNISSLLKGKMTSQSPEIWGPYQVMDNMGYILINVMDGR